MKKDKRGWIRLITSTLVHLTSEREHWVVTLTDISSGGMQCTFYTRPTGEVKEDDAFNCVFVLPTGKVEGSCRIEWIDMGKKTVGISFVHMNPAGREIVESYCLSPF